MSTAAGGGGGGSGSGGAFESSSGVVDGVDFVDVGGVVVVVIADVCIS